MKKLFVVFLLLFIPISAFAQQQAISPEMQQRAADFQQAIAVRIGELEIENATLRAQLKAIAAKVKTTPQSASKP